MHLLYWLAYLLLIALDLGGVLLAAFTLPGTWLILGATAVYAWVTHGPQFVRWPWLLALLILALVAEVGEFVLGGAGARKAGATKWGMFGGLAGAIVGGIALSGVIPVAFPLSTIIGICLGSFIGAFGVEMLLGRPVWQSVRIGLGAAKGRFFGIVGKVTIAIVMLLVSGVAALPIHGRPPIARAATTTGPATASTRPQ
jgi:uncharacterized protein YqgC (DUF456 family)